jgi:hypothetical protein
VQPLKPAFLSVERMEFNVRRQHVFRVMLVIYGVFGISLLYFLFFNTGLSLAPATSADGGVVTVTNTSSHAIRDIVVEFSKGGVHASVAKIPLLLPRESKQFPLTPAMANENGQIELFASAPFHLAVHSIIDAGQSSADVLSSFQFSYPDIGYVNEPVETGVNGCNTSDVALALKVGLELPADPAMNPPALDWAIPANDCASTSLSFVSPIPEENLLLKIRVFTPWRTLGEGTHGVKILPARDANAIVASDSNSPTTGA